MWPVWTVPLLKSAGPIGSGASVEYACDEKVPEGFFAAFDELETIYIKSGVTSIGEWAFAGCKNLKRVHIPYSVTEIGMEAFWLCGAITSAGATGSGCDVELGGITKLPDSIFSGCDNLEKVYLPDTVKEIGDYCFDKTAITTF